MTDSASDWLTAEDLLAGARLTFDVEVPEGLVRPTGGAAEGPGGGEARRVSLRPLSIGTLLLILRAARSEPDLLPALLIKESLERPALSLGQVKQLNLGLVNFLVERIRAISGLGERPTGAADSPFVRATYRMAEQFGWTPGQVQDLTMGQVGVMEAMLDAEGGGVERSARGRSAGER